MHFQVFVLGTLIALANGRQLPGRIQGGEEAEPNSIPYMALTKVGERAWCGGIVLNKRTIITAAHCLGSNRPDTVVLGEHDYNVEEGTEQHVGVESYVIHPDYSGVTNDVALLILEEDIQFNELVQPIELPSPDDHFEPGTLALASGWGRFGSDASSPSQLHEVEVPIISDEECEEIYDEEGYYVDFDIMICVGAVGQGVCYGDSGGPLAIDNVLVGIVSWGARDCADRIPAVYVRATAFTEWILENAA